MNKGTSVSLSSLKAGAKARIAAITAPASIRQRLMEMGLARGIDIEVVRFAPLGDPMEIKVRGYHLSLRRQEAEHIAVQTL